MELYEIPINRIYYFESMENTSESRINVHYHELFEIYYLTYGNCNFFINDKLYIVRQGDIVIVPNGVIHKTNYSSPIHSRMLINCPCELIPSSVQRIVQNGTYVFRGASNRHEINSAFKLIQQEYSKNDVVSEDALKAYLSYLLIRTVRLCNADGEHNRLGSCSEKAVGFIQKGYMNKITLCDAAECCGVSCEHLSRIFKRQTGVGFNEYLTLYRLKKAEEMLVNQTGFSVSDIAYRCGFNDSNYFSCVFKKNYGISPTEKRKSALKNNQ